MITVLVDNAAYIGIGTCRRGDILVKAIVSPLVGSADHCTFVHGRSAVQQHEKRVCWSVGEDRRRFGSYGECKVETPERSGSEDLSCNAKYAITPEPTHDGGTKIWLCARRPRRDIREVLSPLAKAQWPTLGPSKEALEISFCHLASQLEVVVSILSITLRRLQPCCRVQLSHSTHR